MNEQNKKTVQEETPKTTQGVPASQPSSWKRAMSKRWVFPAAYIAAAGIILTLVWVYQGTSEQALNSDPAGVVETGTKGTEETAVVDGEQESMEVVAKSESFVWPVASPSEVSIVKPFYENEGSTEEHEAAMVQYNDTFIPNTGVDLARGDNKSFEVKAALSGKVTRVEQNPLTGQVVEITHDENLKTVYQSLSDVKVKENDEVKQGDAIASAGVNELGKTLGNHLHFEVYEDGQPVNPQGFLPEK
ncbi:M23 family metallopeptidase [Paenibacillus tundrae]|uniref:Stage II sporulation protein Q n=1 Tax=Paenibacillus tundrae TaxID=528187 RepID=A0ABT9WGN2_9BACL|nr:M23 family metallopeptidase [Paenibacillus tundrae]MDQ0172377.1 stage II sporulation protein Q [Paenibacillus tundrae]